MSKPTPARFPVLLVAVALLWCHGAFGYAHQLELPDAPISPAEYAGESVGPHPAHHDADGEHPSGAYFATLLVLLSGALLLSRFRKRTKIEPSALVSSGLRLPSGVLYPPRGPTLPSLQAFRL